MLFYPFLFSFFLFYKCIYFKVCAGGMVILLRGHSVSCKQYRQTLRAQADTSWRLCKYFICRTARGGVGVVWWDEMGWAWIRVLHISDTSDRHWKWISFSPFLSLSLSLSVSTSPFLSRLLGKWASMCFVTLLDTAIKTSPDKGPACVPWWILHDKAKV